MTNLMALLPKLSGNDCNEIIFAVRTFGPTRYRIDPPLYNDLAAVALLVCEDVIPALHEVHRVYGTVAALRLANKLRRLLRRLRF
jgi:hypothetical protein